MVEEKREMSSFFNIADAVVQDAEEADQEFTAPSELCKIRGAIGGCAKYLKHLDNPDSHLALRNNVQAHLWEQHKLDVANTRIDMFKNLLPP